MALGISAAAWAAGAAVASVGVGLYSASKSSDAAKDAAGQQAAAANQADQTQWNMYNQTRADDMPALGARNDALSRLESLLGVGGNAHAPGYGSLRGPVTVGNVTNDPGYQFGMAQGQSALGNQLAAHGMRDSGAAMKAAARYGTDYATTKYDDAFNRQVTNRQLQLNPLQSLAGLGQTGASTMAQAGANAANQIGANQIGVGNAQAANSIAQGNIWGNAANQLSGWYQNYARGGSAQPGGWASGPQSSSWYDSDVYGPQ